MLTQEQISGAVADALPNILQGLREEVAQQAIYQAKGAAIEEVKKAVTEWTKTELLPDVLLALAESKQGLTGFAPKLAADITEALGESMRDALKKKLESSWERQAIFKALLS